MGETVVGSEEITGDISSDEQRILQNMHDEIRDSTKTMNKLEGMPVDC